MLDILKNLLGQMAFMNDAFTYKNVIMIVVACVFLFLAIKLEFEPLLLVPITRWNGGLFPKAKKKLR